MNGRFCLQCCTCADRTTASDLQYMCANCGGEVRVRYLEPQVNDSAVSSVGAQSHVHGMWRYLARLPIQDQRNIVSLGEGDTPLIGLSSKFVDRVGVGVVGAKAEHMNPTGSFKDRIASVAYSMVRDRGLKGCIGTSSGNGGASAAAYGAASGRRTILFTSAGIIPTKLDQIRAYGGCAYLVDGFNDGPGTNEHRIRTLGELAIHHGYLPFLTGFRFSPEIMEGAKTIALELAKEMPEITAVYVPVGGGGLLTALHRGFREASPSLIASPPRLVAVQPSGCATIRLAYQGETDGLHVPVTTRISGLQVTMLFDVIGVISALEESGGHVVEVTDDAIWEAQRILAHEEGLLVEPAGAAAVAGVIRDAATGRLGSNDRVVVILSGAGFKDVDSLRRMAEEKETEVIAADDVPHVLQSVT